MTSQKLSILPDESEFCNICGASQAKGVFKVAEGVAIVGRAAYRFGFSLYFGFFFWMIFLFGILFNPTGSAENIWLCIGLITYFTIIVILTIIVALISIFSWRFTYLIGWASGTSLFGLGLLFPATYLIHPIAGKIFYLLFVGLLTPFAWIWYIVRKGLVKPTPATTSSSKTLASVKHELKDTVREITRFGRR